MSRIQFTQNHMTELTTLCNPANEELETNSEPYQISPIWGALFRTLCNPVIFRTLPYSEPEENSESCQAPMVQPWPTIFRRPRKKIIGQI